MKVEKRELSAESGVVGPNPIITYIRAKHDGAVAHRPKEVQDPRIKYGM
jgi:hypothetical protein